MVLTKLRREVAWQTTMESRLRRISLNFFFFAEWWGRVEHRARNVCMQGDGGQNPSVTIREARDATINYAKLAIYPTCMYHKVRHVTRIVRTVR